MHNLLPQNEAERLYIENITNEIRESGKFNFEFGNIQLRDLIAFADNTDIFDLDFQVSFRRFTFDKPIRADAPRQRYFAGLYLKEKVIALNTKLSFRERSFTLAHEIGHVILGHLPAQFKGQNRAKMELQANYFAYCFLLPSEIFKQVAIGYDFHLGSLSKHFCCPIERVMKRLVMVFEGTQYLSLRTGNSNFSIGKHCKNPIEQSSIMVDGKKLSEENINRFIKQYRIPQNPRAYYRCELPVGSQIFMFKFHTRYDIFQNIEIIGFGYDKEKKYEKVFRDPNGRAL